MELTVVFTLGILLASAAGLPAIWIRVQLKRRLREEKLQHKNAFKRLEASTDDAMFTISEEGNLTTFNTVAERMFGYTASEVIGKPVSLLIPAAAGGSSSAYGLNTLNAAQRTPNGTGLQLTGLRKNGTSVPLDLRLTEARQGLRRLFLGVAHDITDRLVAERSANDVRFLDGILQSVGAPVLVLDSEGRVAKHNRTFEELTGHVDPEGRYYWELLLPAEEWPMAKSGVAQIIASCGSEKLEAIWRNRNGEPIPMALAMTALRAGNAASEHAVVVAFQAPEKSFDAAVNDHATLEAVERLAGGIAQRFNDILTSINGYSELVLHSMPQEDPLRRDVEEIKKAGERAASLTTQLLAFSGKQPLRTSFFNPNTLISNMKPDLEALLGEKIQLSTILDLDAGQLHTDIGWMEQVILNLVINARDAMPEGGKLLIETAHSHFDAIRGRRTAQLAEGEYVMVTVSDSGLGMDTEVKRHLFEPFYTTKRASKGLGMGLSTVYGVVRQSGGNVMVQSIPGSGTSVRIYLPRHTDEEHAERARGLFLVRGAVAGT